MRISVQSGAIGCSSVSVRLEQMSDLGMSGRKVECVWGSTLAVGTHRGGDGR